MNNELVDETYRRIVEESIVRIKHCLNQLSENEIWHKPNTNTNSIGNLVLHLCGNARQWIIHGLAGHIDVRDRTTEFSEKGTISSKKLYALLDTLTADLKLTLPKIASSDLLQKHTIQEHWTESGVSILIHAIEHFSYHTGQITYYTKLIKNIDTGYYSDLKL